MVKKIGGKPPSRKPQETAPVQPTKTVSSTKVGEVGQVGGATAKGAAGKAGGPSGRISAEQREQLFQMIDEEADKLFGKGGLPEEKKSSIKGAVRMVIDAGIVDEEEEES